jgi:hypothetical protein
LISKRWYNTLIFTTFDSNMCLWCM